MIPSHWFRRFLVGLLCLEVGGVLLWIAGAITPNPRDRAFSETVASIVFLLTFYTAAPLAAKFLAPHPCTNPELVARLGRITAGMSNLPPTRLYDHPSANAIAAGILPSMTRLYVTTGLLESMSDEGVRGILAHEQTHIREHHILKIFIYAAAYALASHLIHNMVFTFIGLYFFLAFRRYLEYRADAGAKALSPISAATMIDELEKSYPSKAWERWLTPFSTYPTLPMRRSALVTGHASIF